MTHSSGGESPDPGPRGREPDTDETRTRKPGAGRQKECSFAAHGPHREGASGGSHRCTAARTKVKHRKARASGKSASSDIARISVGRCVCSGDELVVKMNEYYPLRSVGPRAGGRP